MVHCTCKHCLSVCLLFLSLSVCLFISLSLSLSQTRAVFSSDILPLDVADNARFFFSENLFDNGPLHDFYLLATNFLVNMTCIEARTSKILQMSVYSKGTEGENTRYASVLYVWHADAALILYLTCHFWALPIQQQIKI